MSLKSEADLLANTKKERKFTIHLDVWEFRMGLFFGPLPKEKKRIYQQSILFISIKGPSINEVTHLGGRGSARRWRYSISLFSKMGDKGEGGVKNLKILVTLMDGPQINYYQLNSVPLQQFLVT